LTLDDILNRFMLTSIMDKLNYIKDTTLLKSILKHSRFLTKEQGKLISYIIKQGKVSKHYKSQLYDIYHIVNRLNMVNKAKKGYNG